MRKIIARLHVDENDPEEKEEPMMYQEREKITTAMSRVNERGGNASPEGLGLERSKDSSSIVI